MGVEYYSPVTVAEASRLLASHADYTPLAGGTDLVPRLNLRREKQLKGLVYLGGIAEMKQIVDHNDHVFVGALVTHAMIGASDLVRRVAPNVWSASRHLGTPAVRNTGTLGGNMVNASPGGDTCVALLAADAGLLLRSHLEHRLVPVGDFFVGKGRTVLEAGEILYGIRLPRTGGNVVKGSSYQRIGMLKGSSTAVINVAAELEHSGEGICRTARVAVGAVAPTPVRLARLEEILAGATVDRALIGEALGGLDAWINPIDDAYATAWYRRRVARVLLGRALTEASGLPAEEE